MIKGVLLKGGKIRVCGSCADARGIKNITLADGITMSTMAELTEWVVESRQSYQFLELKYNGILKSYASLRGGRLRFHWVFCRRYECDMEHFRSILFQDKICI